MNETKKTVADLRLGWGEVYFVRHDDDGSVPSDIGWDDLDISHKESEAYGITVPVWMSKGLTFGDYDSSCDVERSNVRCLREIIEECGCTHCIEISGCYGSEGILVRMDCTCEEIHDTLTALENYPAIDDEDCSRLAEELHREAWSNFYCKDFTDELRKSLGIEMDGHEDEDEVRELFEAVRERENCYWEIECGGDSYVDIERIAKAVTIHDVVKHFQETEWKFEEQV